MNKLQEIFAWKRREVEASKVALPLSELKARAAETEPIQGFLHALKTSSHAISLIAEVKRASPSEGLIRENFDPTEISAAYRNAGADCLSVLTDERFFGGHAENIRICKETSGLPILRKDFIFDSYQLYEAKVWGADALLLIVAMLEPGQLEGLYAEAKSIGLDVLVEVHSQPEAEIAMSIGAELIGINNRDLGTFKTDLAVTEQIAPLLKGHCHIVSESALASNSDVQRVHSAGANTVLIGTAFCTAPNVESKVREVMNWQ